MALLPADGIKSTSIEGAVFETAMLLQKAEGSMRLNPDNKNFANVAIDTDTKIATITVRMPLAIQYTDKGSVISGKQYTDNLALDNTELIE